VKLLALVLLAIVTFAIGCDRFVELSPPPDGPARDTVVDGPTGDGADASGDAVLDAGIPAD
jgi:hypothetical protein